MSTEYRRGIPSRAHIEAATRLRLLWRCAAYPDHRVLFSLVGGVVHSDYGPFPKAADATTLSQHEQYGAYRPIRTDGTLVDWAVLDAEVARMLGPIVGTVLGTNANGTAQVRLSADDTVSPVAQPTTQPTAQPEPRRFGDVRPDRHGWRWWRVFGCGFNVRLEAEGGRWRWHGQTWFSTLTDVLWTDRTVIPTDEQGNPVSWESIAQAASTPAAPTQPQGFRADLLQRMLRSCFGDGPVDTNGLSLSGITGRENGRMFRFNDDNLLALSGMSEAGYTDAEILARWSVYQELKPLYGIVDGALGEVAMPRDVEEEWTKAARAPARAVGHWRLGRGQTIYLINPYNTRWLPHEQGCGVPLRDFAAVLDAVAEQRVQARQSQPATNLSFTESAFTNRPVPRVTQPAQTAKPAPEVPQPLPRFTEEELSGAEPEAARRQREEAEAQRRRLADLHARLAAERAARKPEPVAESRFANLECDPAADPAASIRAWEARRAKPKRCAIEVEDAET